MKQGGKREEESKSKCNDGKMSKNKRNGGRNRKSNGGRESKSRTQNRSKASVRFDQDEQLEETKAESTDEPEVTGRLVEMRTGRGSSGLIRGRDKRCRADETSRKGEGKGDGGKGEHEGK